MPLVHCSKQLLNAITATCKNSMHERLTRDEMLMAIASVVAMRSTCGRRQVGAVISHQGRVISTGYAGAPSGAPHCSAACESQASLNGGCQRTVHAEANAIAYAARHGIATEGAELHCTLSPCINCAKLIVNSGIKRVTYLESYRIPDGVQLLNSLGILCTQIVLPADLQKTFASHLEILNLVG